MSKSTPYTANVIQEWDLKRQLLVKYGFLTQEQVDALVHPRPKPKRNKGDRAVPKRSRGGTVRYEQPAETTRS